jgi:LacI family transcriptional regulator
MARKTLQDISSETGFAISTISGVLNERPDCYVSETTRERILEAAARLGYRRTASSGPEAKPRSRIIGVVTSLSPKEIPFRHLAGIQRALRGRGYFTALIDAAEDTEEVLQDLIAVRAEGVIMVRDRDDVENFRSDLLDVPLIFVVPRPVPGTCSVVIDRAAAMRALTRHLISLGHRRILFVARTLIGNQCKLDAYQEAMKAAGLSREVRFLEMPGIFEGGLDVVMDNVNLFRSVTGVVTTGDQVAVEVIRGLQSIGISVPQGCSVAGFSDNWAAEMSDPPLTTVHVPREDLGEIVVPMLMSLIAGKKVPDRRIVPKLVHRGSVAPPPGKRRK